MPINRCLQAACLLLALAASQPAVAEITRSCTASVIVATFDKPLALKTLATIDAQGSCKNKLHANDCRERARRELDRCRADMWAGRHTNAVPASCNNLVAGSSRGGAKLQYEGIMVIDEPQRLTARGAFVTCCQLRPKADNVTVSFEGRISGDEKCGSARVGKDNYQDEFGYGKYEMNCKAWREKGICG